MEQPMTDRLAYYIDPDEFDEGYGYVPCVALEGQLGRHGTMRGNGAFASPWYAGKTLEAALKWCVDTNADRDISQEDAEEIMKSAGLERYIP